MDHIYHQYHAHGAVEEVDELTQFIHNNYYWALGFMCFTVVVWVIIEVAKWHPQHYLPFPPYVLALIVFLVMVTVHCIPQMAYCSPCKWIMAGIVVICTTITGCEIIDRVGRVTVYPVMVGVGILILLLNFSGSKCPQEFLPGGVFSTMLMLLLLLVLCLVAIAQLLTESEELLDAFVSILFIMVVIGILIQAQFNHGRLDNVVAVSPKHHQLICILTLYLHTMMFLFCICYFIVSERNRQHAISLTTRNESDYDFDQQVEVQQ